MSSSIAIRPLRSRTRLAPTNLSTGKFSNNIWRAGLTYKFGAY